MHVFEIAAAVVLIVLAVVALIVVFAKEDATTIPLGIALVLGLAGGWLFSYGLHGFHAGFRAKHDAIYRDLTRQGFRVRSDDVYARGGSEDAA